MTVIVTTLFDVLSVALSLTLAVNLVAFVLVGFTKRRLLALPLSDEDRDIVEHFDDMDANERNYIIHNVEQKYIDNK